MPNDPADDGLPSEARRWVAAAVAPGRVDGVRLLKSGWLAVHQITVRGASGMPRGLILRRWVTPDWEREDPDMGPWREAIVLLRLAEAGAPTPRLVAVDEDGGIAGDPAILETRVPGAVRRRPRDRPSFAASLAGPLEWIHAVPIPQADPGPLAYRRYHDPTTIGVPPWAGDRHVWERALEIARRPASPTAVGFIHRDYHPLNVLWSGDGITGVIDWTSASIGPLAVDIGHMRWNLAQAFDHSTADAFLRAARRIGVDAGWSPEWDIRCTLDVVPELRQEGEKETALRRTEEHVARALAELG